MYTPPMLKRSTPYRVREALAMRSPRIFCFFCLSRGTVSLWTSQNAIPSSPPASFCLSGSVGYAILHTCRAWPFITLPATYNPSLGETGVRKNAVADDRETAVRRLFFVATIGTQTSRRIMCETWL